MRRTHLSEAPATAVGRLPHGTRHGCVARLPSPPVMSGSPDQGGMPGKPDAKAPNRWAPPAPSRNRHESSGNPGPQETRRPARGNPPPVHSGQEDAAAPWSSRRFISASTTAAACRAAGWAGTPERRSPSTAWTSHAATTARASPSRSHATSSPSTCTSMPRRSRARHHAAWSPVTRTRCRWPASSCPAPSVLTENNTHAPTRPSPVRGPATTRPSSITLFTAAMRHPPLRRSTSRQSAAQRRAEPAYPAPARGAPGGILAVWRPCGTSPSPAQPFALRRASESKHHVGHAKQVATIAIRWNIPRRPRVFKQAVIHAVCRSLATGTAKLVPQRCRSESAPAHHAGARVQPGLPGGGQGHAFTGTIATMSPARRHGTAAQAAPFRALQSTRGRVAGAAAIPPPTVQQPGRVYGKRRTAVQTGYNRHGAPPS